LTIGSAAPLWWRRCVAWRRQATQTSFFAATVQEEVGLRGAQAAAALIKPDVAISIEGGVTGDAPGGYT